MKNTQESSTKIVDGSIASVKATLAQGSSTHTNFPGVSKQEILVTVAAVRGSPLIEIEVPIEEVRRICEEEGPF
jgi:hypothetical protein